jgi:hypothetical protein
VTGQHQPRAPSLQPMDAADASLTTLFAAVRTATPADSRGSFPGPGGSLQLSRRCRSLQEGTPADILAYVDGTLLVDLWEDLVLPRGVRSAWAPLISLSSQAGS